MAIISDLPIFGNSSVKSQPKTQNFESKTPGTSCATPGPFKKVRIGLLQLVEAGYIDQNLNFFTRFSHKIGHHFPFSEGLNLTTASKFGDKNF